MLDYYVKKDLYLVLSDTQQRIKEWEDKKEEVLRKNPNHGFSELFQLRQLEYACQLFLQGETNCDVVAQKIAKKFNIQLTVGILPVGCSCLHIITQMHQAVQDGLMDYNDRFIPYYKARTNDLHYKLSTYYEAKNLGFQGVEVYDEIHFPIAVYTLKEFMNTDFEHNVTFSPVRLDENGNAIYSSFMQERRQEKYGKGREAYIQMCEQEKFKWKIETTEKELPVEGVVCLNNGLVFKHASNAANYAGLKSASGIRKCCKNMQNYAGKHPITGEKLQWTTYKNYFENSSNN